MLTGDEALAVSAARRTLAHHHIPVPIGFDPIHNQAHSDYLAEQLGMGLRFENIAGVRWVTACTHGVKVRAGTEAWAVTALAASLAPELAE